MSKFYETSIALNQYPDKTVGLPMGLFPSFIFYNEDAFDAAGLDYPTHDYADTSWTMDAMREMAMQMTLDGEGRNATDPDFDPEDIVQWGYSDAWTDLRGLLTKWGFENVGRPMSNDFKTAMVNNPQWVDGLQFYSDGIWVDHFIPDDAANAGLEAAGGDPFGSGQLAMFYSHTWFMSEGLNDLPFGYDLAPLPYNHEGTRISRIHADTFTVPDASKHKDEAWEVMKWLVDDNQIMEVCLIYGCLPANQNVADDFLGVLQERYPGIDYDVIFTAIDYLDNPNHESWVPEWTKVADATNNQMGRITSGEETDAQAALDLANDEVQAILDEYWANQ
jgi:multiple sugar transport system substrate-binding protein